jgi:hypothetical protein
VVVLNVGFGIPLLFIQLNPTPTPTQLLNGSFATFASQGKALGGELAQQIGMVEKAFKAQRAFIEVASKSKKVGRHVYLSGDNGPVRLSRPTPPSPAPFFLTLRFLFETLKISSLRRARCPPC